MSVCEPSAVSALVAVEAAVVGGAGGSDLDAGVDDLVRRQLLFVEVAAVVHVPVDDDLVDDEVVPQDDVAIVCEFVAVGGDVLRRLADRHVGHLGDIAHAVGHLLDHDHHLGRHLGFVRSLCRLLLHVVAEESYRGDHREGQPQHSIRDALP